MKRGMKIAEVLSGRAGLEGVRWLLLGKRVRTVLRRELDALLDGADLLGPCHLRRAKFKPGRKFTAYYDVRVRPVRDCGNPVRPIAVTWTPEASAGWLDSQPVLEMQTEARRRGQMSPFHHLVANVPPDRMSIQISPLDTRFPQLVRMSDPRHVRSILPRVPSRSTAASYAIMPIRYRPGQRHVLRYDAPNPPARTDNGSTFFAKLYAEANRAARSFRVASRVADWLDEHGDGIASFRPLVYSAADAAVLYPEVVGAPLSRHFRGPRRETSRLAWLAGSALRTLHTSSAELTSELQLHTFATELKEVARASEHVDALMPTGARTIAEVLERARELHEQLPEEPPTFAHGDYKADHLFDTPAGLTLIDSDSCYMADPALDLGKFLADLQWWGAGHAQDAFLEGYGVCAAPRLRRARLYEALILVKITVRRVRLFERDWATRTAQLIARAEKALKVGELP